MTRRPVKCAGRFAANIRQVRVGSFANIDPCLLHVRFTQQILISTTLSAIGRHFHAVLFRSCCDVGVQPKGIERHYSFWRARRQVQA